MLASEGISLDAVMKIEKIGKRYSRIGVARAEGDDDISSMLRFFANDSARLQTWRDQAQNAYDAGCAYLKSKGLPAATSVFSWVSTCTPALMSFRSPSIVPS